MTTREFRPILLLLLLLAGCRLENDDQSCDFSAAEWNTDIPRLYSTVRTIAVEVAYEPEAQPFSGNAANGVPYWSVLETNIQALFLGRTLVPATFVPKELREMAALPAQGKTSWTAAEIFDLARSIWEISPTDTMAALYILFLKGNFCKDGEIKPSVVGVSVKGSPVIAIFKDVIADNNSTTVMAQGVEQATIVHEVGHALGLVNGGVPLTTAHQDQQHGTHCTNPHCIMYWQNEGAINLRLFFLQMVGADPPILFGSECLNDTRSYRP